jgi:hypothetical protein
MSANDELILGVQDRNIGIISKRDSPSITRLVTLSIDGLQAMFDNRSHMFCFKLKQTKNGLVQQGQSPRYSAITLLGLHRLEESGIRSPIGLMRVLEGLAQRNDWVDNIGDLGLLVWLCAQVAPERLKEVDERLGVRNALQQYPDARRGQTMELAWFLTGLCYWAAACPEEHSGLKPLAVQAYDALKRNQGKNGIFRHASRTGSLAGRTRGWVGSFADQVYPIYAMVQFAKVYGDKEAEAKALECGHAICDAQGEKGQWWWHYDSSNGQVIQGYPVFSVHQHSMAPMALLALGDLTGKDFDPWIYRGLKWINGDNELHFDMESATEKLVWRCIYRSSSRLKRYINAVLSRRNGAVARSGDLKVLFECRPYELGWLLYAFAGRHAKASSATASVKATKEAR